MQLVRLCTLFLVVSLTSIFVTANELEFAEQREAFQTIEKVWDIHSSQYKNLSLTLEGYPLQPYIEQQKLLNNMSTKSHMDIKTFLSEHRGTPLDWPLRKKWLAYLIKRNRQAWFIDFYVPSSEANFNCYYYRYLLNKGHDEAEVLPKVTSLWLSGKSQPKSCDPLFKQWKKAGYRTDDIVWERIRLAADGGKHTLLPYLTKLLPQDQQYLGKLWLNVRRNPSYLARLNRFKHKSVKETEILTYGLKRLIWRNPKRALIAFNKAEKTFPFTQTQLNEITQKFALALASKDRPEAAHWLHKVDEDYITDLIVQWRIASALRTQNWFTIKKELLSLPESKQEGLLWRYWFARSLIATSHQERGNKILHLLAQERHYYGFLAASYVGKPFELKDAPLVITYAEEQSVANNKGIQRAFEFFYLKRYSKARKEWNYAIESFTEREKQVVAKVAHNKGWFDRAIFTLANVGYLNDVNLRFPLAYSDDISHHASSSEINPAWVYAITRKESIFMSDANSPVNAKGLMQLMPATAKQLVRDKITTQYLLEAKNNIHLGTKYLRQLLDRHKGNNVLATAAYNAGPYRVKSWLKDIKSMPADMWIETIPYKETRNYVKSVLAFQQIYQRKIGEEATDVFEDVHKMRILPSK